MLGGGTTWPMRSSPTSRRRLRASRWLNAMRSSIGSAMKSGICGYAGAVGMLGPRAQGRNPRGGGVAAEEEERGATNEERV